MNLGQTNGRRADRGVSEKAKEEFHFSKQDVKLSYYGFYTLAHTDLYTGSTIN